ncbi:MAG TPA: HAMP domain-containing sensor histidine kinase, partial [Chloroflexota bacterium]|nr:HAMP domain-containing sensor histidine kinase [Chloroflexota bacterium]
MRRADIGAGEDIQSIAAQHHADLAPARARRRSYLAGVASVVIGAYTTFVLVNTQIVGFDTHVPLMPWLFLQDGLDIVAASALVIVAVTVLDRLLERDQKRLVATLDGLARVTTLARRIGAPAEFRERVRPIERETHAQVTDLADTFGDMLTRLEQAIDGQRRLLSDTSHELRNPLTSLTMNLSLLQRQDLSPELLREAAQDSLAAAHRMQRLVNDLLLLARGDMSEVLQLEVIHLDAFLTEVVREVARTEAAPVVLEAAEPAVALADPDRLWQVLRNVVENAQRHTPTTGTITLALRVERGRRNASPPRTGEGTDGGAESDTDGVAGGDEDWAVITCSDT